MKARANASRAGIVMVLALSAWAAGCHTTPPPARVAGPVALPSAPSPPPLVDVGALQARLLADGFTVVLQADDLGRITTMRASQVAVQGFVPKGVSVIEHAALWLQTYGDALGFGPLGAAKPESKEAQAVQPGIVRVTLGFPDAAGCPGLVVAMGYTDSGEIRSPMFTELFCPSTSGGPERLARLREGMSASPAPASPVPAPPSVKAPEEPLAIWLRGAGYVTSAVGRQGGTLRIQLEKGTSVPAGARRTVAARFAKDVARAAGLPELDLLVESHFNGSAGAPKAKPRLRTLSARLTSPPLDGACIDPEVVVMLGEPFVSPSEAGFWISEVHVTCDHEPSAGPKPPADAARTLPKTARRALPFLAACTSVNFAWGDHHAGSVIDKRGDVYTFRGGRPLSGQSTRELSVLVRHEKTYVGTLPPGDVDRLWDLVAKVEREPLLRTTENAADRGGGSCAVFKGGVEGALVRVPMDSYGRDHTAQRHGPSSTEISTLLGRARTLVERGN